MLLSKELRVDKLSNNSVEIIRISNDVITERSMNTKDKPRLDYGEILKYSTFVMERTPKPMP